MPCNSCFCWRDIKRAVVAIGVFAMVTSTMQIMITVAVFTGWLGLGNTIAFTPTLATPIAYELYIALSVFDLILIIFSLVLVCGNERTNEGRARSYFMPWLVFVPLYVIYESAANTYYFYNQFNGLFVNPLAQGKFGFAIVPLIYWIFKDLLLLLGWFVIVHRVHSFCPVHCCTLKPFVAAPVMQPTTTVMTMESPYYTTSSPCSSNVIALPAPAPVPQPHSCGCGGSGSTSVNIVAAQQAPAAPSGGCGCGAFKMQQVQPVIQQQQVQLPVTRYSTCQNVQLMPAVQMPTQMNTQPCYGSGGNGQFTVVGGGATRPGAAWTSSIYNSFFGRNNM